MGSALSRPRPSLNVNRILQNLPARKRLLTARPALSAPANQAGSFSVLNFDQYGFELLFEHAWGSMRWALAGVVGWWLIFLVPLGRREFSSRANIAATPEKIWDAYVLGLGPENGWSGREEVLSREFLPGTPMRLREEFRVPSASMKLLCVIFDVTAFEAPRLFEMRILSRDGVAMAPSEAARERLTLVPLGQSTQAILAFELPVKGLYNFLLLRRYFARVMERLQAHCENRALPAAASGLGWKTGLVLAGLTLLGWVGLMGGTSIAWPMVAIALMLQIVVVVHEFGHWLAMRWFGHRDATITFVPLFGGAAIGGKQEQSAFERGMIALAGPAFSALAILVLLVPAGIWSVDLISSGHAVQDWPSRAKIISGCVAGVFVMMAAPLNLFNLVPMGMLDGARVVDALFQNRLSRALTRLALVAGLMLSVWGLFGWGDTVAYLGALVTLPLLGFLTRKAPKPDFAVPMRPRQRAIAVSILALTLCIHSGVLHFVLGNTLNHVARLQAMHSAFGASEVAYEEDDPCESSVAFADCGDDSAVRAFGALDERPIFVLREFAQFFSRPARYYASATVSLAHAPAPPSLARKWSSEVDGDLSAPSYVAIPVRL